MINRKGFWLGAALAAAAAIGPAAAQEDYPNKPLHIFIGFPAGSGADILGRYFTTKLAEVSKQTVVVENKPGATSNLALSLVAKAKPDGYNLVFVANSNMAGSRFLFKGLNFDTVKDFTPIASFAQITFLLVVKPDSPFNTVAELTAHLKKTKQTKYAFTNQTALLATELYKQIEGLDSTQVAYRTAPEAVPDVINGSVDFMIIDGTFAAGQIRQGRLKPLAVTTAKRLATLPDVPTMQEAGVPNFEFAPWWAVYAPAGTPQPIIAKLTKWMNEVSSSADAAKFLETIASQPLSEDGPGVAAHLQKDIQVWEPIVKAAKIEPQEVN